MPNEGEGPTIVDAGRCPYCEGVAIEYGDYENVDDKLGILVSCEDCAGNWKEIYTLTRRIVGKSPLEA